MKSIFVAAGVCLLSATNTMAKSSVYIGTPEVATAGAVPEVSLNAFSTWMAHVSGTSEEHPMFHWAAVHVQDAIRGLDQLWQHSALKDVADDLFGDHSASQQSMVIVQGADQQAFGVPSMYVSSNDGRSFIDVAADTLGQFVDTAGKKMHSLLNDADTPDNGELAGAFAAHYGSQMDVHLLDVNQAADRGFMRDMEYVYAWLHDDDAKNTVMELTGLQQLGDAYGRDSAVYHAAHSLVQLVVPEMLQVKGTTVVVPPNQRIVHTKRAPQENEKIDIVSDFQLLFWTGVALILLVSAVLVFMYQLGASESSGVVLTAPSLPKQD
ncbi:hypothetical protein BC940DRAFT_295508 [Gongronella butleri]|nr:hypothetical protein BC940DRAFT_295508 [Gongronella butleri]